jgi:hypothetical protein
MPVEKREVGITTSSQIQEPKEVLLRSIALKEEQR